MLGGISNLPLIQHSICCSVMPKLIFTSSGSIGCLFKSTRLHSLFSILLGILLPCALIQLMSFWSVSSPSNLRDIGCTFSLLLLLIFVFASFSAFDLVGPRLICYKAPVPLDGLEGTRDKLLVLLMSSCSATLAF